MEKKFDEKVKDLGAKLCYAENKIKMKEQSLKELKEKYNGIKNQLADLMENEGMKIGSRIVLASGRILILEDFLSVSIPSESKIARERDPHRQMELIGQKERCLFWLDKNGLGDIIKNKITADFGRDDKEQTRATVMKTLLEKNGVNFKNEQTVHPQTLKATIKDSLKQGKDVPFDDFNLVSGVNVKIK